jgi:vacuolar-type H+-ATPase subunit E/Vma4
MSPTPDRGPSLRSRLARRRLWDAVADRGAALALGAVLVVTAGAYVLGVRGVLTPVAWQAGLAAGLGFVVLRALLGLIARRDTPEILREELAAHFGEEIRADPDVTRLARQAIEQRLQLATAQAAAPRPLARAIDTILPSLDQRLDVIASEARAAASRRGAARFQAGMAQMAQQRLTEVTRIADAAAPDVAATARKAADGLTAQVAASGGLVAHAEDRLIALDHAVAEFGTVVAQALLSLSKGDLAALELLGRDLKGGFVAH